MGLTAPPPVLDLAPSSPGAPPATRPWLWIAITLSILAICLLAPMRSRSQHCQALAPEQLQAALEHPDQHFLSLRLMSVGDNGLPAAPDRYAFTLVQGLPETGLPTISIELVRAADGSEIFRSSTGSARQAEMLQRCMLLDASKFRTACRYGELKAGTRIVRCGLQDSEGHLQAIGFVVEDPLDPHRRAFFAHLDERMRLIGAGIPDTDLPAAWKPASAPTSINSSVAESKS